MSAESHEKNKRGQSFSASQNIAPTKLDMIRADFKKKKGGKYSLHKSNSHTTN